MSTSGQISESSTETRDLTPQQFVNLRSPVRGGIAGIINSGGGANFGGNFSAPETDSERQTRALLHGLTFAPGQNEQASRDFLGSTIRGEGLDPSTNPGLASVLSRGRREIGSAFEDASLENRALFSRAGQRLPESSPFAMAQAKIGESAGNALGDFVGNVLNQNFQSEQNRRLQASSQNQALDQFNFDRAQSNLQAQALPRLIEQQGISGAINEFNRRQEMLAQMLGLGGQLGTPSLGQFGESFSFGTSMG